VDNKKLYNYISYVHYVVKEIVVVKPQCPLCLCGGKNTSTRFGESSIPDRDQFGQNSNTE
jgi:hypothetical protein